MEHAGYSWMPGKETRAEGKRRCARQLALAERVASDAGWSFEWKHDNQTDESFRDTDSPYLLWVCVARDGSGTVVGSLCGVDFGPDSDPWSAPYRRVVEAELANENIQP